MPSVTGVLRVPAATGLQKAVRRGRVVVVANRYLASSKTCLVPGCGYQVDRLPLTVREWICSVCGAVHDRDVNVEEEAQGARFHYARLHSHHLTDGCFVSSNRYPTP